MMKGVRIIKQDLMIPFTGCEDYNYAQRSKAVLVSYATEKFYGSQANLNLSAIRYGIDYIVSWSASSLYSKYPGFYQACKEILDAGRGAGYWLWKPFILLEAMAKADDGDIIVYFDSATEVVGNLEAIFDICRQSNEGILLFSNGDFLNKVWTKRDCFTLMDCDSEKYWDGLHLNAAFQIYRKNKYSWNFLSEYLHYCQNINIITDIPNVCGLDNLPAFRDHRHDQSVLSLLAEKYNIEGYRDPSQWGNHKKAPEFRKEGEWLAVDYVENYAKNSPYDTLLNHHRQHLTIV